MKRDVVNMVVLLQGQNGIPGAPGTPGDSIKGEKGDTGGCSCETGRSHDLFMSYPVL